MSFLADARSSFKWRLAASRASLRQNVGHAVDYCSGRYVELRGNIVVIDGCSFSVDSPGISTDVKSNFMFNRYEVPEREAVQRFLDPKLPVVELGGSIGVISCLTNRKLIDPARHIVVEANPDVVPLLESNRDRNHCTFTVLPRVIAYGEEYVVFYGNRTCFLGSSAILHPEAQRVETINAVKVKTTNLRFILEEYDFDRCTLICDIEGAEAALIDHEADTIASRVQTLMLEVHEFFLGKERVRGLLATIQRLGFRSVFRQGSTYVFQGTHDPEV